MKNRIIIVGAGGSGKDLLKKRFIDKGFEPSISCTSRPPRDGEEDGVHYNFLTADTFEKMVENGEFYEHKSFRGWYYGTLLMDFSECDVFIMTPPAVEELDKDVRDSSIVMFLDIEEPIRAKRLSGRNDSDSIKRRLIADREMFEFFTDYDVRITSPSF